MYSVKPSKLTSYRTIELCKGQSILEILIAVAIGALLIIAAASIIAPVLRINTQTIHAQRAGALGKALLENVRVWSEGDWHRIQNLATTSANLYYLNATSSPFTSLTGVESIVVSTTTYKRYFYTNDVARDTSGNIVVSGGSNDPSTKKITIGYNWPQGATTTFSTYLTRNRTNIYDQTDWSAGPGQSGPATTTNNKFATSTGNISYTSSTGSIILTLAGTSVGGVNNWSSTTALPVGRSHHASVIWNNYVYVLGGLAPGNTSSVLYAPINSTGSLGAWLTTTALPSARDDFPWVVNNGYIYMIGGRIWPTYYSTVYYTSSTASGALNPWLLNTQSLPNTLARYGSVVWNGYVYAIGGVIIEPVTATSTTSTVLYAQINTSTGAVGAWTSTTPLPNESFAHNSIVNNGYVYVIGGRDSNLNNTTTVLYALINSTGSLGVWQRTTPLPYENYNYNSHLSSFNNGYVYVMAGASGSDVGTSTVVYARVNSTGSLGAWAATTPLPGKTYDHTENVNNGFGYRIGGNTQSGYTSTVWYTDFQ